MNTSIDIPMTIERARDIWRNYDMSDADLQEWVNIVNLRKDDDPRIPKGCTVEVNPLTGETIPDAKLLD
jgi:hypothetical protein